MIMVFQSIKCGVCPCFDFSHEDIKGVRWGQCSGIIELFNVVEDINSLSETCLLRKMLNQWRKDGQGT